MSRHSYLSARQARELDAILDVGLPIVLICVFSVGVLWLGVKIGGMNLGAPAMLVTFTVGVGLLASWLHQRS